MEQTQEIDTKFIERGKKLKSFKYLLLLAIPMFLELLLQLIVGYSDQIMMRKYPTAVTAITNANSILNIVIGSFTIFSSAAIILITQFKGSKNIASEKKVYSTAFFFNTITSIIISLLLLIFGRFFLKWIKCPDDAYAEAVKYLMITGSLIFMQLISITFAALLKANSFMRESMIINVIVNALNILGNLILIPHYQIVGVAIASALSRFVGLILMAIIYTIKVGVKFKFNEFLHGGFILKYVGIGVPISSESFSYQASQLIILVVINSYGTDIVNVKTYASMFAMVTYLITESVSLSMQVVIGELFGRGDIESAKKKIWQTLILGVITSTAIATIWVIFSDPCFRMFDITDTELLDIAKKVMICDLVLEVGRAFNIIFVRTMQTSGDVLFPTVLSIIFCWVVAVGGSFVLGSKSILGYGIVGVWIVMAADECMRAIIFLIRFRSGRWAKTKLIGGN
ncbi:MAG: MATE family efflux transporter [Acholeplasmatales bacterium]|nr:MATE family efflux transporter [Acholeplasmatales bacterium]